MVSNFELFRFTNSNDTISSIANSERVQFDAPILANGSRETAYPDNNSYLKMYQTMMSRTDATIGAPYDERARKPDTGYKGTRYIFDVYFDEYNGPSPAVDRLTEWYVEGNTERGKFKDGRIGIRNNYRPKLNVTPLYESGYKFVLFELLHDLKYKSEAHARIILEYSGTGADSIT